MRSFRKATSRRNHDQAFSQWGCLCHVQERRSDAESIPCTDRRRAYTGCNSAPVRWNSVHYGRPVWRGEYTHTASGQYRWCVISSNVTDEVTVKLGTRKPTADTTWHIVEMHPAPKRPGRMPQTVLNAITYVDIGLRNIPAASGFKHIACL